MKYSFSLKGGSLVGTLLLATLAHADQWSFFHPELVTKYTCSTYAVDMHVTGTGEGMDMWQAEAKWDTRDGLHYSIDLARFPLNLKGKHKAEKACEKWSDEADKRIRKAR